MVQNARTPRKIDAQTARPSSPGSPARGVAGRDGLAEFDRGGIELPGSTLEAFREALVRENHTVKRALTSPAAARDE